MVGLSIQDSNLQSVFSKAKQVNPWPWPCAPQAPGHVFCEDIIKEGQIDVLKIVYGHAYNDNVDAIHASTHLRAWGEQVLLAFVLKLIADKLKKLMELALHEVAKASMTTEFAALLIGLRDHVADLAIGDRLNRVWRDLFVRLAPNEPFAPAFRIPASSTQELQPTLITEYRDSGEAGGTPAAMLSAGNLNTAALTLFIALHLSVPKALPWLIFDDPVQSMDDLHIAHFASLLRTLSKEHGRQVVISVHDRQLFEYLRLELSPAFADDSLLTLELSRRARQDTLCMSQRLRFQEETALQIVA